jgi:hypothetical protein
MMVTEQNVDLVDYPPTGVGGLYGVVTIDQYLIIEEPATIYLDNGMFLFYPGNKYDQWCFDNLPQGKYVLWAERNINNVTYSSQRYNVTVPTDEKAYMPIYLPIKNPVTYHQQPSQMINVIHGSVDQKNGALLPGAKVELYRCDGGPIQLKGTTWSDLNGQFRFDNVDVNTPTAKYLVRITYEAGGSQRTQDSDQFTVYYTNTLNVNHDYDIEVTIQDVTTGSAMIRSVPAGARISIDGMDTGKVTPGSISLKTGAHMLGLSLEGYFCDNSTLQVQPDASMNITRTLKLSTGNLSLNVNPANAQVFIDGKLAGTGPLTLAKKPAGEYAYVLVCDGYWNESGTISVLPGESITKEINMVASPGISLSFIGHLINSFLEAIGHIF